MTFKAHETREILDLIKAGASAMVGGSRCHQTYFGKDGEFFREDFDEGYTETFPISRENLRQVIAHWPDEFRGVLHDARWARFSEAFVAGDPARAEEHLLDARRYATALGKKSCDILQAWLWFPVRLPSQRVAEEIVSELRGYTAYHVFMQAVRWDRSPEAGRKGVLFVERLMEMVGEVDGCFEVRATFYEQAGDYAAALADLERERARTPTSRAYRLSSLARRVVRVTEKLNAEAP